MAKKILITGATGKVASPLVSRLKAQGADVRVLVRNPEKAESLKKAGAEIVVGDFEKPETLGPAFAGVDAVFLVTAAGPKAADWVSALLVAAKASGKPHIVRLSALKAGEDGPTDNTRQHGRADKETQASGLPYTILRPHLYMQNFLMSAPQLATDGSMYQGMGNGKMGMIDTRDITDAAFAILTNPSAHAGKIYDLTGPASITMHDVAATLSKVLGRPIKYVPISPDAVAENMKKFGMGDWFQKVMRDYSQAYSDNWGDFTTGDVTKLTGKPPRSVEQFAREVLAPAIPAAAAR